MTDIIEYVKDRTENELSTLQNRSPKSHLLGSSLVKSSNEMESAEHLQRDDYGIGLYFFSYLIDNFYILRLKLIDIVQTCILPHYRTIQSFLVELYSSIYMTILQCCIEILHQPVR